MFYEVLSSNGDARVIRLHWTRVNVEDFHGTNLSYSIFAEEFIANTKNCFNELNNVHNEVARFKIYSLNEVCVKINKVDKEKVQT